MLRHYMASGSRYRYAIVHAICLLVLSTSFLLADEVPPVPGPEPFSKTKVVQPKRSTRVHTSELCLAEFGVLRVSDSGILHVSVPDVVETEVEVIEKKGLYVPVIPGPDTGPTKTVFVEQLQLVSLHLSGCHLRRAGTGESVSVKSLPKGEDLPLVLVHEARSLSRFVKRLIRPESLVLFVPNQEEGKR